jgi:hypothetical protein
MRLKSGGHVTVSVDKRAVKSAIESGFDIPGAQLVVGINTLVRR